MVTEVIYSTDILLQKFKHIKKFEKMFYSEYTHTYHFDSTNKIFPFFFLVYHVSISPTLLWIFKSICGNLTYFTILSPTIEHLKDKLQITNIFFFLCHRIPQVYKPYHRRSKYFLKCICGSRIEFTQKQIK